MLKTRHWAMACLCAGMIAQTAVRVEASDSDVAAVVNGKKITTAELDAKALRTNMKLAQSVYDARKKVLDDIIMEKLLESEAKSKGMTPSALLEQRIAAKTRPVSDASVQAYYNTNKGRMRGRTLEQVGGQIRAMLVRQNKASARASVLAELKKNAKVKITLDPPRADVAFASNDPVKGPKDAKVTIVEFSDFQ